jgi:hypothetical protein
MSGNKEQLKALPQTSFEIGGLYPEAPFVLARRTVQKKTARPERRTRRSSERLSRSVHVNKEIADTAGNENGRNGPQNQDRHFLLQLLFRMEPPSDYCSVHTLVVFTADSASVLVL